MNKQQVVQQQVEVCLADAAFVEVKVLIQDATHLLDATIGGIAFPLSYFGIQCLTNDVDVCGNHAAHIVTGMHLYLFDWQNNGYFGVVGTHNAHGFRPAVAVTDYVSRSLFFDASFASCASEARFGFLFIFYKY